MSGSTAGVRVVDLPNLGVVTDATLLVGEKSGVGSFLATALRDYQHQTTPGYFPTIAALRLNTGYSAAAFVAGYYAAFDGGDGMFVPNASDTTTADNAGTIIVDAAGQRWYRIMPSSAPWSVLWFGASTTLSDNTAAFNRAIAALPAGVRPKLTVPPGTFLFTGSLAITSGGFDLGGASQYATVLNFANGSADCFVVGFQAGAVQGVSIHDMSIVGVSKTGGTAINAKNFSNATFYNLSMRSLFNGFVVNQLNNVTIYTVEILLTVTGANYGIFWQSPANNTQRSDVLTLRDVVVNGFGTGATGLAVDGMCQTLRVSNCGLIRCGYGLVVSNSAASNTYFPAFFYINDLEIDGVDHNSVLISGGREMHFHNLDCFNAGGGGADTHCVQLMADGSASVTSYITFTSSRLAGARQAGLYCEADHVDVVASYIGDNSIAGSGAYPGIILNNNGLTNGAAVGFNLIGGRSIVFGDLANQSYGVTVASGCSHVNVVGFDASNCVTGAILDNSGSPGNVSWHACININGAPLADRLQIMAGSPSPLIEGQMWEDITSHALKVVLNGAVKTVTVT